MPFDLYHLFILCHLFGCISTYHEYQIHIVILFVMTSDYFTHCTNKNVICTKFCAQKHKYTNTHLTRRCLFFGSISSMTRFCVIVNGGMVEWLNGMMIKIHFVLYFKLSMNGLCMWMWTSFFHIIQQFNCISIRFSMFKGGNIYSM